MPAVLDHIFKQAFGPHLIPRFGQVDQVVVHAIAKHSSEVFVVLAGPLVEKCPVGRLC